MGTPVTFGTARNAAPVSGSLVFFPTETESMKDIVTGETIFPSLFPRRCWSARPERATVIRVSPAESEIRCKMKIAGVARPQHISD